MRRFVLSLLAVFLALTFCHAQVPTVNPVNGVNPAVFNTAGGTYDDPSSYFRFEWSFGELVLVQAFAPVDSAIVLTHGVLQPCTDKITKSPPSLYFASGEYRLFPNPTTAKFELDFFLRLQGRMTLQLIDATGRTLETRSYYYGGCCRIDYFDLTKYPDGIYMIVADLRPDSPRSDGLFVTRHSAIKVIKSQPK